MARTTCNYHPRRGKPLTDASIYRFGPFTLDLGREILEGPDGPVHLRPRAFAVLRVLVEASPRLVPRDELVDRVWESQFVTAAALTQTISELRSALGDSREQPQYVDTVPRKGYRFVAPVATGDAPRPQRDAPMPGGGRRRRFGTRAGLALAAVLLLLALVPLSRVRLRTGADTGPEPVPTRRPRAVVTDFVDSSRDSAHAWLGTALAEALRVELLESPALEVVPGDHLPHPTLVQPTPDAQLDQLESVGRAYAADYVIYGSYAVVGSADKDLRVVLSVNALSRSGSRVQSTVTGDADDLQDLVQRTLNEVLSAVQLDSTPQPSGRVGTALPMALHALRPFSEGLAALRASDPQAALEPLQRAAQEAPASPLAHWALARAWRQLGWDERARHEAQLARRLAEDLPPELRLPIEALEAELAGSWAEAVRLYQALNTFYPDDVDYALQLIDAQVEAGMTREALEDVDRIRRTGPADPLLVLRLDLAEAHLAGAIGEEHQRIDAATHAAQQARAQGRPALVADATEQLAHGYERLGDIGSAQARYAEARELFTACGSTWRAAVIRHAEAELAARLGDYGEAEKALADFDRLIDQTGNLQGRVRGLVLRARILQYRGEHASALPLYDEALEICDRIGFVKGSLLVRVDRANVLAHCGDLHQAIEILSSVLGQSHDLADRPMEAAARANLGTYQVLSGAPRTAVATFEGALSLLRELSNPWGEANVLENLGLLHLQFGEIERGEERLSKALELYDTLGRKPKVVMCWVSLGSAALERGDLDTAGERFETARKLAAALDDRVARARATSMLLAVAVERGDVHRALGLRDQLVNLGRSFEDPGDESVSLAQQAGVALLLDDPAGASKLLEQARERAVASSQPLQVEEVRLSHAEAALAAESDSGALAVELAEIAEACRHLDFPGGVAQAEALLGEALLKSSLSDEARTALEKSRNSSSTGRVGLRQTLLEARIDRVEGRLAEAARLAAEAQRQASARGMAGEALDAGLLAAEVAFANGDPDRARALLDEVAAAASTGGLARLERRARELRAAWGSPSS